MLLHGCLYWSRWCKTVCSIRSSDLTKFSWCPDTPNHPLIDILHVLHLTRFYLSYFPLMLAKTVTFHSKLIGNIYLFLINFANFHILISCQCSICCKGTLLFSQGSTIHNSLEKYVQILYLFRCSYWNGYQFGRRRKGNGSNKNE